MNIDRTKLEIVALILKPLNQHDENTTCTGPHIEFDFKVTGGILGFSFVDGTVLLTKFHYLFNFSVFTDPEDALNLICVKYY